MTCGVNSKDVFAFSLCRERLGSVTVAAGCGVELAEASVFGTRGGYPRVAGSVTEGEEVALFLTAGLRHRWTRCSVGAVRMVGIVGQVDPWSARGGQSVSG